MLLLLFISAKMRLIKPLTIQRLSSLPPPPLAHPLPTNSKTSSTVIFARNIVIVIAIMFFICGLLHILVRYLIKRKRLLSSSPNSHHQSSRFQESAGDDGEAYERQLQQLFNLHDSGLDQTFIDALPVFSYKELMGLKEPFDCAVCLCEFTKQDNLRLLPSCSHAFHIHCIDTWLLSNSTCPLCRGTLFIPGFSVENPVFEFDDSREEEDHGISGHFKPSEGYIPPSGTLPVYRSHGHNGGGKPRTSQQQEVGPSIMDAHHPTTGASMRGLVKQSEGSIGNEKRVYSVRLGKFRATNVVKKEEKEMGETSNSNLDARRCYSMGTYEYVVATSDLQVAFVPNRGSSRRGSFRNKDKANGSNDGGSDGKKLSNRSKGESFSVSKIWLWSKKDHHHKGQISSGTHMVNSSVNVSLPLRNANNSHT